MTHILALDPEIRRGLGGLRYLAASAKELARLALPARRILVVENKQTALALPDLPATVAFVALGKGVSVLADLPWISNARIDYWGDIDTHGFHTLDLARRHLPGVRSVLMDRSTLLAHRARWVEEAPQHSATDLLHLDDAERALYDAPKRQCWRQNVRLEQERIHRDRVLHRIVGRPRILALH